MTRSLGITAVLSAALVFTAVPLSAQNATSGGDQQAQPDAQGNVQRGTPVGGQRRGAGGPGGGQARGAMVRGTVAGISGSSVTVKNDAGETWTVITTDNTRIMRDRQTLPVSGIQTGDEVVAMGVPDDDKHEVHAVMLMDVSAADVAKAKANLGKTYIVGRVTAINDTQLTVLRQDKVSQVISLDETTSLHRGGRPSAEAMQAAGLDMSPLGMGGGGFAMGGMGAPGGGAMGAGRRGGRNGGEGTPPNEAGESITLADVKVGDTVVGTGSVKGGSFVPTDLHVMEQRGGGRRGPGGVGGGAPPDGAPPQQ